MLTATGVMSDGEIIQRVLGGEPALFELLMRRHNQRVYRTVRAILRRDDDCEDVMQQAYVNAFVHLRQFESHAQFSTWLTRIAVNEAIQRGRRLERRPEVHLFDEDDSIAPSAADPNPEHAAYATELGDVLESAVDALPTHYRTVFVLRVVEGMSTEETAASLEINEDTVKTRLHRAKVQLRQHLVERLGTTSPQVYAFHLTRCDRVVASVMQQLGIANGRG
jgi:RNA polymerase sigma-70 factor (ECF subfamily)